MSQFCGYVSRGKFNEEWKKTFFTINEINETEIFLPFYKTRALHYILIQVTSQ